MARSSRLLVLVCVQILALTAQGRWTNQRAARAATAARKLSQANALSETSTSFVGVPPAPPGDISDGQSLVLDTTVSPLNTVGRLQITVNSTETALCSGALIAPNVVLTAAHCWFDPDSGQTDQNAQFIPGYNPFAEDGIVAPQGQANVKAVKVPSAFTSCPTGSYSTCFAQSDFAVAFLDASFKNTFAYGYGSSLPAQETVYTAGYPGDKCVTEDFTSCSMWFTKCSATYSDALPEGQDTCLSGEGQSGAPIWVDTSADGAAIVGVLTSTPFNSRYVAPDGETQTLYTMITPANYQTLQTWSASGPGTKDAGTTLYTLAISSGQ